MTTTLRTRTLGAITVLLAVSLSLLLGQAPNNAGAGADKGKAKGKAGPPGANHPERIQVLILTGQNPHDWRGTTPSLRKTLEDTEKFEVRVVEEFRGGTAEMLAPYNVLVVYYYDGRPQNRWGERAENAVSEFVRSGNGLVLYHLSL